MFQYPFMQHAFLAGTAVAIMCGVIGVFVIARNLSFMAHAFSHIGFSGASFAVFAGWNPLNGLLLFIVASALAMGQMGVKFFRRDASISVVLSLFLGLGILFLSLSAQQAGFTITILFGSVVGISMQNVREILWLTLFVLVSLTLGYKVLKFDSFDPAGAEASGLPVRLISIGFLLLLSIGVAGAIQIVGALMVFTLMTIPAAAARYFTQSIFGMILVSSVFAILGVWFGLVLGYITGASVSFYIAAFETVVYLLGIGLHKFQIRYQAGRS